MDFLKGFIFKKELLAMTKIILHILEGCIRQQVQGVLLFLIKLARMFGKVYMAIGIGMAVNVNLRRKITKEDMCSFFFLQREVYFPWTHEYPTSP